MSQVHWELPAGIVERLHVVAERRGATDDQVAAEMLSAQLVEDNLKPKVGEAAPGRLSLIGIGEARPGFSARLAEERLENEGMASSQS